MGSLAVFGVGRAFAGPGSDAERSWESRYDARLAQALDGTPAAAAIYCQDVLDDLGATDPLLGRAWYLLGQARAEEGDAQGAADAWEHAANAAVPSPAAHAILARFDELGKPIESVPRQCNFDEADDEDLCGLHRVWNRRGEGAPELVPNGDGRMLAWTTIVRADDADTLEAAFRKPEAVRSVSFRVRASDIVSDVRVALDDGAGGRVQSNYFLVRTDEWTEVDLPVASFRAAEEGGWLGRARLFRIEDLTGKLSEDRGANTLWIDDLELR